nr:uracil phosphoribosyltransferase [Allomuricauda sp.]
MSKFFYGIEDFFVNIFFKYLYDPWRFMDSWWASNSINWIFTIICFVAMFYWMKELKIFNDNGEEDKSISSHSYL